MPAAPLAPVKPPDDLRPLEGEWLYVEDRTPDRAVEDRQPSMSGIFTVRFEEDALVVQRGDGARGDVRLPLDGSPAEVATTNTLTRRRGEWKDGAFQYQTEIIRVPEGSTIGLFRTELRPTEEGLLVAVAVEQPSTMESVALYRHPEDIALPEAAKGAIDDLKWLSGAWVGSRGAASLEERWTPPAGGAMLGASRTVARGSMAAFEFLRIVERDGGLVYIAQPNGASPTEFVLTELGPTRAVFENPRHDFPQRIVYELTPEGGLTASIGHINGGRPRRFEFTREASPAAAP